MRKQDDEELIQIESDRFNLYNFYLQEFCNDDGRNNINALVSVSQDKEIS